ncbi:O-acyltransferase like protein-like [Ptychodera flava]|uniref:O-acyltransferase like protein-like n=1 Tax=Ptychodera flava TaxID=63121 RepID=UPI003969E3D0
MVLCKSFFVVAVLINMSRASEFGQEKKNLANFLSRTRNMKTLRADVYKSLPNIEESFFNLPVQSSQNSGDKDVYRNVSTECAEDMIEYTADLLKNEHYALQMFSANGGIAKDFMVTGSCQDIGTFSQCLAVLDTPTTSNFKGKYCLVGIEQDADVPSTELLFFRFGFCLPDSCSDEDVVEIIKIMVSESVYSWNVESSCIEKKPIDAGTVVFICFVGIVLILVILSTSYDVVTKTTMQKIGKKRIDTENRTGQSFQLGWWKAILVNFSLFKNWNKLTAEGGPGILQINGFLRVFGVQWAMITGLAMDYRINDRESLYANPIGFWESAGSKLWFQPILNIMVTDVIIVNFATTQAYLTLKELKKYGRIYWVPYFLKHYLFITIPVTLNLFGVMFLVDYTQGPYWNIFYGPRQQACNDYWWTHLIYMNNMIPFPGVPTDRCLPWAWLLALEMQMYFISAPFVLLLHRSWKKALYVGGAITIICSCVIAALATYFGHSVGRAQGPYNDNYMKHFGSMYHDILIDKFWNWWPSFLVSHFVGYLVFVNEERKFKLRWYYNVIGWTFSTLAAVSIIYGIWPTYRGTPMPQWESVLYLTYYHTAFCSAICWIIFACVTGNGGPVKTYLMAKLWIPLGRSAFTSYLWHKPLMAVFMYSLNKLFFYTTFSFIYLFLAMYVFISGVSLVFNLCVEAPILGIWVLIEGELYKRRARQSCRRQDHVTEQVDTSEEEH